jgi:SAM-dependent methyltransferase
VALSDLFTRRRNEDQHGGDGLVHPTKVLDRFLSGLKGRAQPVLLDLGPVVGTNVSFFGEEVGCKIRVEELSKDIDRHVTEGKLDALPAFFDTRFPQESESIDGILCWDIFDYLDRPSAERLARQLTRILRPDGVLLALFSAGSPADARPATHQRYTKHIVVDRGQLQYRTYAGLRAKQRPLVNRDIQRMFEPLQIIENFLLKNHQREMLFRKPR